MGSERSLILLATLGQRPEAITVALDILRATYPYDLLGIIHTDPLHSGIATALRQLETVLAQDYPELAVRRHCVTYPNNLPLLDILDGRSAEAYYHSVVEILRHYRGLGAMLHLLVAGGRKAMSIYATLAATLVCGPQDRVWTILSPAEMVMQPGQFHAPADLQRRITLVALPLLQAHRADDEDATAIIDDGGGMLVTREQVRNGLLALLTRAERVLAEALERHPYAGNDHLAEQLGCWVRTVENHLRSIYRKLLLYLERDHPTLGYMHNRNKRQALLDILQRRGG